MNKIHHRQSTRLKGYDYSQAGAYFITICTHNRGCLFGNITDGEMVLNEIGEIANECWLQIPVHFPNTVLHEHIVMPNHIHGIIELKTGVIGLVGANKHSPHNDDNATTDVGAKNFSPNNTGTGVNTPNNIGANVDLPNNNIGANVDLPNNNIGANVYSPLRDLTENNKRANIYSPQQSFKSPSKTIGSIVRGYKIGVTKWVHSNTDIKIVWQRNYHDHIIRNEQSYKTISDYIINNPKNWKDDKFFV